MDLKCVTMHSHFPHPALLPSPVQAPAALASPALRPPDQFEFSVTVVPFHRLLCNMLQNTDGKDVKRQKRQIFLQLFVQYWHPASV